MSIEPRSDALATSGNFWKIGDQCEQHRAAERVTEVEAIVQHIGSIGNSDPGDSDHCSGELKLPHNTGNARATKATF